ncbi:uncharacterized protein PgNI_03138 [Pyricularia grisea]|uniref:Uncharacterized protein n=1 Tax=Pyricularia grisea TaxID=148305 RepID=A0A6P8BA53_PYRGI|nr:uncharacterized protein PgNI_03138 [Pyricularia grisea]TLD12689.1 hypothetical protein PgNI_03138 [Pyricularia grisea]
MLFSILNPVINGRGPGDPILESTDGKEKYTIIRSKGEEKLLPGKVRTLAYGDVNIAGCSETS